MSSSTKPRKRYLSKSRFKLGNECPSKLFYTGKPEYSNQKSEDDFLMALADGGILVGELAKHYFPGGHDIETLNYEDALDQTNKLLEQDQVTIYEAAVATDTLFIRADVLVKDNDDLYLYEVKSSSIDPNEEHVMTTKKGNIKKGKWLTYLEDVAFQRYVINQALPQYKVHPHLTVLNKAAKCGIDGLHQKFLLKRNAEGFAKVELTDEITPDDLRPKLLTNISVAHLCDMIVDTVTTSSDLNLTFEAKIEHFASNYAADTKINAPFTSACKKCEFYTKPEEAAQGLLDGRQECWSRTLNWSGEDFSKSTVLELAGGRVDPFIREGAIELSDLTAEDLKVKEDNKPGISSSERRYMQVEKYREGDNSPWIDKEGLTSEIAGWTFPLHFIDFETASEAIPFNKGNRPYEPIAFQFSHHKLDEDGNISHAGEFINTEVGNFPNFDFLRELKSQLQTDEGTILIYSHHENTYLNHIYKQLHSQGRNLEDKQELIDFITDISKASSKADDEWHGNRCMVDLCALVARHYFNPATKGSNSLKYVLPAILNSSPFLKEFYGQPTYGSERGVFSKNFTNWQWIETDDTGKVVDPYKQLPQLFEDVELDKLEELLTKDDQLKNGGAAMTAYSKMQYTEMSDYEREELTAALLKYCELDTLAMVMLYQHWQELLS